MSGVLLRLKTEWNGALISGKRINTVPVFSRLKTLLVESGQDSVVPSASTWILKSSSWARRISFSDLSCFARQAVRLASSVSNLTSPCNVNEKRYRYYHDFSKTWSSEDKYKEISSTFIDLPQELHFWVFIAIKGGDRATRNLPHAKMLLVPILFFLSWVDYALEGSTFY